MASGFLGWTPKDTAQQVQNLARRTTVVAFSKYALVVLAVVLLIAVFAVPALHDTSGGGARIVFSGIQEGETSKPHMSNPRFQGVDASDQPYELAATMAEQQEDGTILLTDLEASITLANGNWLMFMGNKGVYDREVETLHLPENVQAFYDEGYEMSTTQVTLDLNRATAVGKKPVSSHGPLGKLRADGFTVDNEQRVLRFEPNVKVTLYPGARFNQAENE